MSQEDETTEFLGVVQTQQDRIAALEQLARDADNLFLLNPLNILPESVSSNAKKWYSKVKKWQERYHELLGIGTLSVPHVTIAEKREEDE